MALIATHATVRPDTSETTVNHPLTTVAALIALMVLLASTNPMPSCASARQDTQAFTVNLEYYLPSRQTVAHFS